MWRALTILIVAFWLVMTGLLFRGVYYPEGSQFAEVPVRAVFQKFLQGAADVSTLHVYHRDKKIGYASLNTSQVGPKTRENDYFILGSGLLEKGAVESVDDQIAWRVDFRLEDLEKWGGSTGQIRMPKNGSVLDFIWKKGERLPKFTLKQQGMVVADEKMVSPMVEQMLGGGAIPMMPPGVDVPTNANVSELVKVKGREGALTIAGQSRKGYVLEFRLVNRWNVKAFFTEAGQLALIDLPEGYRLVEPIIYGLVPDYTEEDVEE